MTKNILAKMRKQERISSLVTSWFSVAVFCVVVGFYSPGTLFAEGGAVSLSSTTRYVKLDPLVDVLEDPTGKLSLADVTDVKQISYWLPSSGNLNFGFTDSAYWIRVIFYNESKKNIPFLMEITYPVIDMITVHILSEKGVETFDMGDHLPFDIRPKKLKDFVFPLNIGAGKTVSVLMRFKSANAMQMPLSVYQPGYFIEIKQVQTTIMGLYFGAMAVLMIYNLFLFSSVRDVDYLYYAMYVFSLCLFFAGVKGITFQYVFSESPYWNDKVVGASINAIIVTGSLFAMSFLKLKQVWPRAYWGFMVFPLAGTVIVLFSLVFPYNQTIIWTIVLILLVLIYGLPVLIIRWIRGFHAARFFVPAWLCLAGGALVFMANKLGYLPRVPLTENAPQLGSVIQVILLSISLADRLNMERRGKIKAQKKAQQEERAARIAQEKALENEKKERIAREEIYAIQKKARETLEIQVFERKRELDATLAEVKLANSRIMSSLRYARIIQMAMLPDPEMIRIWLPRHFIWWLPRDVVGGDFYHVDRVAGATVVCVADCTGHGVHGAFMTIISGFELKRILRGEHIVDPEKILKKLNKRLRTFLKPKTGSVFLDDGLSIGLCTIEPKKARIQFAGARMNLHILQGEAVKTIKGGRSGVGFMASRDDETYDVHHVDYYSTLKFYMATDGIAGQPGARLGRRFGSKRIKQILTEHASLPLAVQQEILEASLNVYKGNRDQVDDITMVGFSPD